MKKHISLILAFAIALSIFGVIGAGCTLPKKEDVNALLATDITQAAKDLYKTVTGKDLPPVIADRLNAELVAKIAAGTGYMGITTIVCNFIAEYTGIVLPPETLALAIKAAFLIYGLL